MAAAYLEQKAEIDSAIAETVARGDFISGAALKAFEAEFAGFCGLPHAVGCSNGTSAIHLALAAAGVKRGDEVIVPAMTFIATSEAVMHTGAQVVFADIDPATLNLDARSAERRITSRTRAILFVHLHGNTAGVAEAAELARRRGIALIEDCAQAHGAAHMVDGRRVPVGGFGIAAAFSFFPAKNLGAFGDAGAVVTADPDAARRMRLLANHGREEKYLHLVEGYNYRLDTLQAAILRAKLPRLSEQVARRNGRARAYREQLAGLPIQWQQGSPGATHALHLFVLQTDRRDALQAHLRSRNIETGIHYPIALHRQPAYAHLGLEAGSLPASERLAETTLSLPMYPQLPLDHVARVCDAVREFFAG